MGSHPPATPPPTRPNRKHALEIRCPDSPSPEPLVASPVPAIVVEMQRTDWEPAATFVPSSSKPGGGRDWPTLGQIGISWTCFTEDRQGDKGRVEFASSTDVLMMNSEMPVNSDTLRKQASHWESTEEARQQAYSAWVSSQSKRVRSLASNVPQQHAVAGVPALT